MGRSRLQLACGVLIMLLSVKTGKTIAAKLRVEGDKALMALIFCVLPEASDFLRTLRSTSDYATADGARCG